MGLKLAVKAFFRAFKQPQATIAFLSNKEASKAIDSSHFQLLQALQNAGRLIDFFQEDMSVFSDAQIGAIARKIQKDCSQRLDELMAIKPVLEDAEGSSIHITDGFNPSEIKLIGRIKGKPPFKGTIRHKGWKASKLVLPKQLKRTNNEVLMPAEVEVNS